MLGPALSGRKIWSAVDRSSIFHPLRFGPAMSGPVFLGPHFLWSAIVRSRIFSRPLPHPATPDSGYDSPNNGGDSLLEWASCSHLVVVHGPGSFQSARWERDFSSDLRWVSSTGGHPLPAGCQVLGDFPRSQHRPSLVHTALTLPLLRSTG